VKAIDRCVTAGSSVVAVAPDQGRRVASGVGAWHSLAHQQFQLAPPNPATHIVQRWARAHVLEKRPLEKTLRL